MGLGPDTPITQSITGNTSQYLADTQMSAAAVTASADSSLTSAATIPNNVQITEHTNGGETDRPPQTSAS